MSEAWQLFTQIAEKDVISWSAMIGALAKHGRACMAIELLQEMLRAKIEPNEITSVGFLSALCTCWLVERGTYINSMRNDYNIEPGIEHYICLINFLGGLVALDGSQTWEERASDTRFSYMGFPARLLQNLSES